MEIKNKTIVVTGGASGLGEATVRSFLKAGANGALASVVSSVSDSSGEPINYMYYWLKGFLYSFLDTYKLCIR